MSEFPPVVCREQRREKKESALQYMVFGAGSKTQKTRKPLIHKDLRVSGGEAGI